MKVPGFLKFIILSLSLMSVLSSSAEGFKEPDFAYPKTVEANADSLLAAAGQASSPRQAGIMRLRALLELTAASTAIDPDSIFACPAKIAGIAASEADPTARGLMELYQAVVLEKIYSRRRYSYDRVAAPPTLLPADPSEWSGEQFKARIAELIGSSQALTAGSTTPTADYAAVLDCDSLAAVYLPTIADAASARAQNLAEQIGNMALAGKIVGERLAAAAANSDGYFYWLSESCRMHTYDAPNDDDNALRKALLEQYEKYSAVEAARLLLFKAIEVDAEDYVAFDFNSPEEYKKKRSRAEAAGRRISIERMRRSLAMFPRWWGNGLFENAIRKLKQPSVHSVTPMFLAPGVSVNITLKCNYARTVGYRLYALPAGDNHIPAKDIAAGKYRLVDEVTLEADPEGYEKEIITQLCLPKSGRYALMMTIDGKPDDAYNIIHGAPFLPMVFTGIEKATVATVDFVSGRPLAGVDVSINSYNPRKYKKKRLGRTDAKGMYSYDVAELSRKYNTYSFAYKGRDYGQIFNLNPGRIMPENNSGVTHYASIFTERPIYHPGDSLGVAVIVSRSKENSSGADAVAAGCDIAVALLDANHQAVDTLRLSTDACGRAEGSFVIPKGRLTGNYSLNVEYAGRRIGSQGVMVSDFRLPTFEAKVNSVERDVPAPGAVRISGDALTYTGMPVAGARVVAHIFGAHRLRWFFPIAELGDIDAVTDARGGFTIDIPAELLAKKAGNKVPYIDFTAKIEVTATTAETASTSRNFTTGRRYTLAAEGLGGNVDAGKPVVFKLMAYDANGNNAPIALRWKLYDYKTRDIVAAEGSASAGDEISADWSALDAGRYILGICAADSTQAYDAKPAADITLYNIAAGKVPEGSLLFMPLSNYKADAAGKARVCFGVSKESAWVYKALCRGKEIVGINVAEYGPGFHYIDVDMAGGDDDDATLAKLVLVSYLNGNAYEQTAMIERNDESRRLEIKAESFRDRLVPGSGETWRLRISGSDGRPAADAAMIATLYNRALNSLTRLSWPKGFASHYSATAMNVCTGSRGFAYFYSRLPYDVVNVPDLDAPHFRFTSSIFDFNRVFYTRGAMMKSAPTVSNAEVVEEEVLADTESFDGAPTTVIRGLVSEKLYAAAGALAEAEDTEAGGDDNGDRAPEDGEADFAYRESETLQAFWMPRLVAGDDGVVELVFNVPNANGAWMLDAFAWTPDLKSGSHNATCVSSKPVMVQPNLPRFLRQGDTAVVPATVFNNSGSEAVVTTTVEIFDSATGKVVATTSRTDSIAAGASAVVDMRVEAPASAASIGYRVRSVAGNFADGEQNVIPVLASAATVIESSEFYLNPTESKPYELTVDTRDAASVTLQYCQNPIWNIVRAMRGLSTPNSSMAAEAASALFSALASQRILADNPAIEAVIGQWRADASSEALTSMLSRNPQLKTLLLDQTPWVQSAAEQSRRMEMLARAFDREAVGEAIDTDIDALKKAQTDDGGFRWGSWCGQPSVWTTKSVLITMGIANSLDMLPSGNKELSAMIAKAVGYVDRSVSANASKDETDRELALIHALLPKFKASKAAQAIIDRTVGAIASSWKKDRATDKAYDILILLAAGRRDTAADILGSLRQFGTVRPGMGMCFPSVDDIRGYATIIQAFAAMDASAAELDAMRQWICVRSQAIDDLGAYNPDYVIAATMLTGSCWTDVAASDCVSVDGRAIELDKVDSASGYFARAIDSRSPRTVLSIRPNGVTPSYGSVITISSRAATSVKARPGKDVSIEKRFLVKGDDGKWRSSESFRLGQRVKVQLTLKVKRDLQYVAITDERAAALEPVDQLPGNIFENGLYFYRENRDASTAIFIDRLPRGTYQLSYEMTANNSGSFSSGIATLQSQYAPEITAHSGGTLIGVDDRR